MYIYKKKSSNSSIKKYFNDGDNNSLYISTRTISHNTWLTYLGFSYHLTPHKEWFSTYTIDYEGGVFLGDNNTYHIFGNGKVYLCFNDGRVKTLNSFFAYSRTCKKLILCIQFEWF